MEWKHGNVDRPPQGHFSLKPSLVEWKQNLNKTIGYNYINLETFLSGMETSFHLGPELDLPGLETFLSGMETSI